MQLPQGKFPEYMDFIDRFDKYLGGEAWFETDESEMIDSLAKLGYPNKLRWEVPIDLWVDLTTMYSKGDDRLVKFVGNILSTMDIYWI